MNLEEMREMLRSEAERPKRAEPEPEPKPPASVAPPPQHHNARSSVVLPAGLSSAIGDMHITPDGTMKICTESGTPGVWVDVGDEDEGAVSGGRLLGLDDLAAVLKVKRTANIDGSMEIKATLEAYILFGLAERRELEDARLRAALATVGFNHLDHIEVQSTADGDKIFTQIQRSHDPF